MKYFTYTLLISGVLLFASCGWSDKQIETERNLLDKGFMQGIEGSGQTVDPEVKEAWLDCVMEKVVEKWSFDEVTEKPELMDEVQHDCAKEVGLYEAVEVR
ncbi:hypothetical protein OAK35_01185 [Crocinitomicaceae bacterium]|nr:hypothetical protein [Crocinitomicaceae bacterium]MDC0257335.1 hypothetical protein [Crocinitomicaceae bacterium]